MTWTVRTTADPNSAADVNYLGDRCVERGATGTLAAGATVGSMGVDTTLAKPMVKTAAGWVYIDADPHVVCTSASFSGASSVPAGSTTTIAWTTALRNTGTMWAGGVSSRFTAPTAGVYRLGATVALQGVATTASLLQLNINGSGYAASAFTLGASYYCATLTVDVVLTAGQYAELTFYNGHSANVTPNGTITGWMRREAL